MSDVLPSFLKDEAPPPPLSTCSDSLSVHGRRLVTVKKLDSGFGFSLRGSAPVHILAISPGTHHPLSQVLLKYV